MPMTDEIAAVDAATPAIAPAPTEREVEARAQGWTPKEEFKGKAENWTDADEYLKRGDPKYLRERLRVVEKAGLTAKQELARQMAEQDAVFKDRLDRMGKASARALEMQRDRIYADFEAKKLAAVEDGDTDKYRAIQKAETAEREKFAKEDAELAVETEPKRKAGDKIEGHESEIADWWAENPDIWMDEKKAKYAGLLYGKAERNPELKSIKDRLRFVEDGLKRANGGNGASDDDKAPEARMPSVEGGARTASNGVRKKGWSDIPAEERAIYTRHIKDKLYKDQAEAAAVHWSE